VAGLVLRESHLSQSATGNIGPIGENLHKRRMGPRLGQKIQRNQATSNDAFKVCSGEHVQISRKNVGGSAVFT